MRLNEGPEDGDGDEGGMAVPGSSGAGRSGGDSTCTRRPRGFRRAAALPIALNGSSVSDSPVGSTRKAPACNPQKAA